MFGSILSAIANIAGAIGKFLDFREREDHKKAGRNEQVLKQHEDKDTARALMDAVEKPTEKSTVDKLREGGF